MTIVQRISIRMMMVTATTLFLVGCASSPNQSLNPRFWTQASPALTVVAVEKPPRAELDRKGPQALVGLVGSRLTSLDFALHLRTYSASGIRAAQNTFVNALQQRHIPAQAYDTTLPPRFKNYASIGMQPDNQNILVLNIRKLGAQRKYIGAIPTGAPKAFCIAEGRLIRLADNKSLWYFSAKKAVDVPISAGTTWDQPPDYPLFTQALNTAVSESMNALLQDFVAQAPR